MKRNRYTEEWIISILKEHEAGASAADLFRRYGVAEDSNKRVSGIPGRLTRPSRRCGVKGGKDRGEKE